MVETATVQGPDGPIKLRYGLGQEVHELTNCTERELLAMILIELREVRRATRSTELELQVIKTKMRP